MLNKLIDADELMTHVKDFVVENPDGTTIKTPYIDPTFVIAAEDKTPKVSNPPLKFLQFHSAGTTVYVNSNHLHYFFEIKNSAFKTRIVTTERSFDVDETVEEIIGMV